MPTVVQAMKGTFQNSHPGRVHKDIHLPIWYPKEFIPSFTCLVT